MGFPQPTLTNEGKKLLLCAIAGEELRFSTIKIGDGNVIASTDLTNLTSLINEVHSFNISSLNRENDKVTLYSSFNNEELAESFSFREIGVFAIDPVTNAEVLYSYTNCGEEAERIEATSVGFVEKTIKVIVVVDSVENVTIVVNPDLNFVTKAEFNDAVGDIEKKLNSKGSGDMSKAEYDADNDGIVDDAKRLNGHPDSYFVKAVTGKTLSSNDYTTAEKNKLSGISPGANKITKVSELENDAGYVKDIELPEGVQVIDNLNSTASNAALSAKQGRELENKKVDKIEGKGLSTNDFDDEYLAIINNINNKVSQIPVMYYGSNSVALIDYENGYRGGTFQSYTPCEFSSYNVFVTCRTSSPLEVSVSVEKDLNSYVIYFYTSEPLETIEFDYWIVGN